MTSYRSPRITHGGPRRVLKALGALSAATTHQIKDGDLIDLSLATNVTLTVAGVKDGDDFWVKAVSSCCGTLTLQIQGEGGSATAVTQINDVDASTTDGFTDNDTNLIHVQVWDASAGTAYATFSVDV